MAYPNGKKKYAELDLQERWEWHSENYAWRHLTLGVPLERGNNPTDPTGAFFDLEMIEREVETLRQKRTKMRKAGKPQKPDPDIAIGRAICNQYARDRGFPDFNTAYDAGKISYAEVVSHTLATTGGLRKMPGVPRRSEVKDAAE